MTEKKARDIVMSLARRNGLGERLVRQVGRRAWERPNVAVSGRIFRLYRLGDPWDPSADSQDPIALGPVSLRLGEGRREPAPHARPMATPSPRPPVRGLPDGPAAPRGRPSDSPARLRPASPPSPQTGEPSELAREFGAPERPKLVGKLPVRPDLAARLTPVPSPPVAAPRPAPDPGALPRPPLPASPSSRTNAGSPRSARFSLKRTQPARAIGAALAEPEVVMLDAPPAEAGTPVVEPGPDDGRTARQKPVNRSIPTGPASLDDLFGMASDAGRMTIGRSRKTTGTGDGE